MRINVQSNASYMSVEGTRSRTEGYSFLRYHPSKWQNNPNQLLNMDMLLPNKTKGIQYYGHGYIYDRQYWLGLQLLEHLGCADHWGPR